MEGIVNALRERKRLRVVGIQGSGGAYVLSRLRGEVPGPWTVIVRDAERAEAVAQDLRFYLPQGTEVLIFPSWELLPFDEASPYLGLQWQRMGLLRRLALGDPPQALVVPAEAWMTRLVPRQWLLAQGLCLAPGCRLGLEAVAGFLQARGYQRVPLVEEPGDYSLRGGILDCFAPGREEPVRLDFAEDGVESIRSFSPDTQRSTGRLEGVEIFPVREIPWGPAERGSALARLEARMPRRSGLGLSSLLDNLAEGIPFPGMEFLLPLFHPRLATLMEHLPDRSLVVLDDPEALEEAWETLWRRAGERAASEKLPLAHVFSPEALYVAPREVSRELEERGCLELAGIHIQRPGEDASGIMQLPMASHAGLRAELMSGPWDGEVLGRLAQKFQQWLGEGIAVHWAIRSRSQAERLGEHLGSMGVPAWVEESPWDAKASRPRVWIHVGDLSQGFLAASLGLAFLNEEELFGAQHLRRPSRRPRKIPSLTHLEDLQAGDLVVHVEHGIGIYRGLDTLEVGGLRGDFLHLEYVGRDKLYVPVDRFQSVHKYVGTEGVLPRIDRLGGSAWEKRKGRVKKAVERLAKELLQLYAVREVAQGHAFSPPDELYREFERAFSYEETPDQHRAIEDVMEDMSLPRPMDRLICGDVGFGKTEVAIRAAFRAVMDGKQVAYLVPTTILADQHHDTFVERLRGHPVFIEVLSRFRTPREQRRILDRCERGEVDILIGTHRLLQKDVRFKTLGLLILDEEHRFGVAHKERLKRMRKEVDVLTLTATPIPRTLHMAMLGIRDLSLIETPPPERLSIRTVVAPFERGLVCEAVEREMARGGQVFFVHNRVQGIERIAGTLREWLPSVRLGIAHGQMAERELARVMERFHGRQIDLLLCTTIIEAGLDIPTANTILIHDAHKLGLAEMYQIRGRVGRSGHQAYAYLLLPEGEGGLTGEALQRLQTLQEFSELGAGYRIATRDLEIRGAGTLLGSAQSGHTEAVGFELYTQLMRRAIAELKGEPLPPLVEPEIQLPIHAYLPEDYVSDAHQRLALYRRLSRVEAEEEIQPLREEMADRFGSLPEEGENLLHLVGLRVLLRSLGIRHLSVADSKLRVTFDPSTSVSPQALVGLIQSRPREGIRFLSPETLEVPLEGVEDQPVPLAARKRLKALFQGGTMSA
jgi:transcription-repair coupling factor (superfamily II helicase)